MPKTSIILYLSPWKRKRLAEAARIAALRGRDGEQCARCRRDPVRVAPAPEPKPYSPEREIWRTVAGVTAFGLAAVALAVGIGAITTRLVAAEGPPPPPFRQCYAGGGPTCVLDGDTIFIN